MPASDILLHDDQFYILATSALADDRTRVLKHDETFAIYDRYGDIVPVGRGEQGLYHEGTRFLSQLSLRLAGQRPLLLSSTVLESNELLAVDLANPDLFLHGTTLQAHRPLVDGDRHVPRGSIHVFRARFLWHGAAYERLRLTSFLADPVDLAVRFDFAADFADIFEIRGVTRVRRGTLLAPEVHADRVVLGYVGLDGVTRRTTLALSPPADLAADHAGYELRLCRGHPTEIYVTAACALDERPVQISSYHAAFTDNERGLAAAGARSAHVHSSNEQFNEWITRSSADLFMLTTQTPTGPYPYAGVPWYSTAFGRDALITAMECLWTDPDMARGVLEFLASTQADRDDPERDAEPGKILHERRDGELAALDEIPFGRYYGSVDATPLFVMLAGEHYRRTGDLAMASRLWPHVERALAWIDGHPGGFVAYQRRAGTGLTNQGWKDSTDAVFHADGSLAEPPIALCEVQGYVHAARLQAAALAEVLGRPERAARERAAAAALRQRFDRAFWCEDLGTYALALDRYQRPCRVRTSNAGHALFTGIALPERASVLAETLLADHSFSGWGVRTVASDERRYNPMSYHNGSVWPHDNALIAAGLAAYGRQDEASRLATTLFYASRFVDLHRMPELFCGLVRRTGEGPTLYPVACAPQAWAAGAPWLLLQSLLGLTIDAPARELRFTSPSLPVFLRWLEIQNLRIGDARVDLRLERHPGDVGVRVLAREGELRIVETK